MMTKANFRVSSFRARRHTALTPRLAGLLVLGGLLALLPPGFTGCARVIVQPVEWLRMITTGSARGVRSAALSAVEPAPTIRQFDQALDEKAALERLVAHQSLRIDELERRVDELSNVRGQFSNPNSRIVVASVIAVGDGAPRRETITIDRGSGNTPQGAEVQVGHWVVAGESFQQARSSGASGLTLLSRHSIIGSIAEVHSLTSRVQLGTDPAFGPQKVRLARRLADGTLLVDPRDCLLQGAGGGKMIIRQFPENPFDSNFETLVLVLADATLPGTIAIGRVTGARSHADAPLVFDLIVEPLEPPSTAEHVFVVIP